MKRCTKCRKLKPAEAFSQRFTLGSIVRIPTCRECIRIADQKRRHDRKVWDDAIGD